MIDRRGFLAGAAAVGAGTSPGSAPRPPQRKRYWVGWQGYDEPLKLGSFLADNGIALATTYINTNEEIITRLQAGGAGQVDLITIYYGHIPILIAADLLEPIDESKVPGIADVFPEFLNVDVLRKDGKLYAVPFTWGTLSMVYDPAAAPKPDVVEGCAEGRIQGQGRAGRRRDRAARHLGADRHRHEDADPADHGRAQEDRSTSSSTSRRTTPAPCRRATARRPTSSPAARW